MVMSEALFDREIRKSQGVDVDEPKGLRNFSKESSLGKKRPPNESDDEKAPDSKRLKKSEGLLSPNRTIRTSYEARQERKNSISRLPSTEETELPTALDLHPSADGSNDFYCWVCHKEGEVVCCDICPRVYHSDCLPRMNSKKHSQNEFFCPECTRIQDAENTDTRTPSMKNVSANDLSVMLRHALTQLRPTGVEPFLTPVDTVQNPIYPDYIFHPMDLSLIEKNVKDKKYGSTDAFIADVKWIQHNCVIFNGPDSPLSAVAKKIVRAAEKECQDLENCPGCYIGPLKNPTDWFTQACDIIHPIVWGKLSGYPTWPGKALGYSSQSRDVNKSAKTQVDIRFFGQHDKAWVGVQSVTCFTNSEPAQKPSKQKREYETALKELEQYVASLKKKHGSLKIYPHKTTFNPDVHFKMSNIFDGYTEDGKKPEIPKIPPLRKESLPSSLGNKQKAKDSLSKLSSSFGLSPASIDLRAAAKEPAKSDSSDDDSQVNETYDFPSDDSDDGLPKIGLVRNDPESKRRPKRGDPKEEPKSLPSTPSEREKRATKRIRSESPAELITPKEKLKTPRTDSPRSFEKSGEKGVPPPPPKTTKTTESAKNPYARSEKDSKVREKAKKRDLDRVATSSPVIPKDNTKIISMGSSAFDVPKDSTKNLFDKKSVAELIRSTDSIGNNLPVMGLPPRVTLGNYTDRVMLNLREVLKDVYGEILQSLDGAGHSDALRLEVDRLKWQHEMELAEMRHNNELTIAEIRQSLENEKKNSVDEIRKKMEKEKQDAILETKKKQWCANCGKEAVFYCCWNTSYCDYPCQQGHWPTHMATCSQGQGGQKPT